MKIVADDRIPFLKGVFEKFADVVYLPGKSISPADVADADALIVRTRTRCDRKLLAGSKVRLAATATIGLIISMPLTWLSAGSVGATLPAAMPTV